VLKPCAKLPGKKVEMWGGMVGFKTPSDVIFRQIFAQGTRRFLPALAPQLEPCYLVALMS